MRNLKLKVYKEPGGWVYDVIDADQAHLWTRAGMAAVVTLGLGKTFEETLADGIRDLREAKGEME